MTTTRTHHFALTGGIASGKSVVSAWFEANTPWMVLDADIVSRRLTSSGGAAIEPIRSTFGEKYILNDAIDREAMRELVFNSRDALRALENILHPMIRSTMQTLREQSSAAISLSVIPLLVETGQSAHFERVITVDCAREVQRERLLTRPGIDQQVAEKMINAQASRRERLRCAKDVIYNHGTLDELENACKLLTQWYTTFTQ